MISFHLRPVFFKSVENFLKYLTWGTTRGRLRTKTLFCHIFFRANQNVLHMICQCIKTFFLSCQPHMYDLLHLILLLLLLILNLGHKVLLESQKKTSCFRMRCRNVCNWDSLSPCCVWPHKALNCWIIMNFVLIYCTKNEASRLKMPFNKTNNSKKKFCNALPMFNCYLNWLERR